MLKRLLVLLPAVLFAACEPNTTTKGQLITCETDPASGVVTRCAPGEPDQGDGQHSCQDIDEDGDGNPSDTDDNDDEDSEGDHQSEGTSHGGDHLDCTADCEETPDSDGDGIDDDHDCDEQEGEDDCDGGDGDGHPDDDDTSESDDAGETPAP